MRSAARAMVVLVHGPPSVGKTSFSLAFQDALRSPFLLIEADQWLPRPPGGVWKPDDFQAVRDRVARGLYAAVASFADHGNNIIVDGLLPSSDALKRSCISELERHRLIVIGLTASAGTLIHRERLRGDRAHGTAVGQIKSAHANVQYDILLDAEHADPRTLADQAVTQLNDLFGVA